MEIHDDTFEIDRRGLADRVYHVLKREIVSGTLAPGQRLSLDEFAGYFGVSITPIRDALRLLAADGLVELNSHRSAFVTRPSRRVVEEVFQFREILECAAVESVMAKGQAAIDELERLVEQIRATNVGESHSDYLAYINLDQRIHQFMIDCMGNAKISETYAGLGAFSLIAHVLYSAPDQRASATLAEHESILAALRSADPEQVHAVIRRHLRNARSDVLQRVPDGPPPAVGGR